MFFSRFFFPTPKFLFFLFRKGKLLFLFLIYFNLKKSVIFGMYFQQSPPLPLKKRPKYTCQKNKRLFPLKATKLHLQKYLFLLQELKTCRHYFFFSHIKPCLSIFSFFYVLGSFLCNFRIPIGLYLRSNMKDIFFYHPFGGLSLIKREL